jgi:hypothetical protein
MFDALQSPARLLRGQSGLLICHVLWSRRKTGYDTRFAERNVGGELPVRGSPLSRPEG